MLTQSDRDYLGWKLAERIAFLLSKPSKRQETSKSVTDLYNKRSRFVHQDEQSAKYKITESDYRTIGDMLLKTIWKLIELKKKGYTHLQKAGKRSVVDYINKLKFA